LFLGRRCDGGAQRRIATRDELEQPTLEHRAFEQDVAIAGPAAQSDVGAEAIEQPGVAATGVLPPESDDVTEEQRDDWGI
jgi:hypothetical protein